MRFKFDTIFSLSLCDVAKSPQDFPNPIIIVDRNLKIVSKNKKASALFSKMRKGGNVGRYMTVYHEEKVLSLLPQQTVYVELKSGETFYGATAVGFSDWILLLIRPMWSGIHRRLEAIYGKASGYEANVSSEYNAAEDVLSAFLEKHCAVRNVGFFNVHTMASTVISQLEAVSPSVFGRIKASAPFKELWAFGSEYDFSVVLAYALFISSDYTRDDIWVSFAASDEVLSITISGESNKTDEEIDAFVEKFARGGLHWMAPIKMLVDGNLWDLDLDITEDNRICLSFKLPLAESKQPFVLMDSHKEFILHILRGFFA